VATVRIKSHHELAFTLHLYRPGPDGEPGSWTSKPVSVEERPRDKVCPIPRTARRILYHTPAKAITLGGARGTVGWVPGSISGEAYSSATCWRTAPSFVTCRCPCRPGATGRSSSMALQATTATMLSTRAKTLSSTSRWRSPSQLGCPGPSLHLILTPTMNGCAVRSAPCHTRLGAW